MQIKLFGWIREGVRQSVLLGVQDAVGQLGESDHDDLNSRIRESIEQSPMLGEPASKTKTRRRRLGRSLNDSKPQQ